MNQNKSEKKIIVIGAGAAGLACGSKLLDLGYENIIVLEAHSEVGGRVRKLPKEQNFADFDIELGAEEVHGMNTDYYKLVVDNGGKLFEYWTENHFYTKYADNFTYLDDLVKEHPDLKFFWDLYTDGVYTQDEFPDVTLKEYLISKNISEDTFFFANAMIGVEAGSDFDQISIKGFSNMWKAFSAGKTNYFLTNTTHVDILKKGFSKIIEKVKFNTELKHIDYTENDNIKLTDSKGDVYLCDKCIITVPVTQLKKLQFIPHLPVKISTAIQNLRMDNCAKIIMRFTRNFLPKDSSWVITPGFVTTYWSTTQKKDSSLNIVTGMTGGENSRILNKMYKENKEEFINTILSDFEKALGVEGVKDCLEDFFWLDWADVPFIEGGYSYCFVGETDERASLRESVDSRIFFAGEAIAESGHLGTIHGAIESGFRAASLI